MREHGADGRKCLFRRDGALFLEEGDGVFQGAGVGRFEEREETRIRKAHRQHLEEEEEEDEEDEEENEEENEDEEEEAEDEEEDKEVEEEDEYEEEEEEEEENDDEVGEEGKIRGSGRPIAYIWRLRPGADGDGGGMCIEGGGGGADGEGVKCVWARGVGAGRLLESECRL